MVLLPVKLGITRPTFEEYPNRRNSDSLVTYIPQNSDYRYNEEDLINFFGRNKVDNILLINPDNPSGNFISHKGLLKLARWCKEKHIRLIVDESFVDFTEDWRNNTLLHNDILEEFPQLIVMKSISKSYGVPGIRLGILCSADTSIITEIKSHVSIWNINSFCEFFMQIYNKYENDYYDACDKFIEERKNFEQQLKSISFLRVMPSQANFFLVEVLQPFTANSLVLTMLKRYNILLRDCTSKVGFDGKQYMRIAVRDNKDNSKIIEAFKQLDTEK